MVEEGGRRGGGGVPEKVMEAVTTTLSTIQHLTSNHLLLLLQPQVLADLPPLQRAQCLLDLVKLTTYLFALRLRCAGVHPEDHEVTAEFEQERVRRYQSKLANYLSLSKGARRSDRGKGQSKRRVQL